MLPCARPLWTCGSHALRRYIPVASGLVLRNSIDVQRRHAGETAKSRPKTIFSGIQPTGVPHLGNYLGALKQWVKLQNEAERETTLIYSLVDLHAITVRQDPSLLRQWKNESLAMLLAIGLDPERSIIFHQSDVAAHVELMWILSCQASTGYLSRMTQWKDKTANERENGEKLKLGLYSYPVLMASDVLVHGTTHVPVGHDQAQHLEFAREIAIAFNHAFGDGVLVPPDTIISPARRIMSLSDPTTKMSKSHPNPKSRILLTDTEDVIGSKIKSAVTDSDGSVTYDSTRRPGVSNLLDILLHSAVEPGFTSPHDLANDMEASSMKAVKERVANGIEKTIRPIREKYYEVVQNRKVLDEVAAQGRERAQKSAAVTVEKVKHAVGLA